MKIKLLILFAILQTTSYASQIAVGLNSENIIVWNFWENNSGVLKHYLCLYNKTEGEIKVEIRLKRFKENGISFEVVKTDKVFYNVALQAGQLKKLEYPEKLTEKDFMAFSETEKAIGLLDINSDKPYKSFINEKYKYYTNAGINGGSSRFFWVRFESIYNANTSVGIIARFRNSEYFLLKIINKNKDDGEPYWGKLYTLQKTDQSIIKIDHASKVYTFPLQREFGQEKVALFTLILECIQGEGIDAQNCRFPVFKTN